MKSCSPVTFPSAGQLKIVPSLTPDQGADPFVTGNGRRCQSHVLHDARLAPLADVRNADPAEQTDRVSGRARDCQIADRVVSPIEGPGEGCPGCIQSVGVRDVRGDHSLLEQPSAGQIGIEIDIRHQHETLVQQIRIAVDGDQLLGRGDLIRIARLARSAGKGLGLDGSARHQQTYQDETERARTCSDRNAHGLGLRLKVDKCVGSAARTDSPHASCSPSRTQIDLSSLFPGCRSSRQDTRTGRNGQGRKAPGSTSHNSARNGRACWKVGGTAGWPLIS